MPWARPYLISVKAGALAWMVLVGAGAGRGVGVAAAWVVFLAGGAVLDAATRPHRDA
jgi:hypothetical protein